MKNQIQEDIEETASYLEKSSRCDNRRFKKEKALKHSKNRAERENRKYEDGFKGNYK